LEPSKIVMTQKSPRYLCDAIVVEFLVTEVNAIASKSWVDCGLCVDVIVGPHLRIFRFPRINDGLVLTIHSEVNTMVVY
jgi:hypothetical protein